MKKKRPNILKDCSNKLTGIFGFHLTPEYIRRKIFIVHLRNHLYENLTEKEEALHAWCEVVLDRSRRKSYLPMI